MWRAALREGAKDRLLSGPCPSRPGPRPTRQPLGLLFSQERARPPPEPHAFSEHVSLATAPRVQELVRPGVFRESTERLPACLQNCRDEGNSAAACRVSALEIRFSSHTDRTRRGLRNLCLHAEAPTPGHVLRQFHPALAWGVTPLTRVHVPHPGPGGRPA